MLRWNGFGRSILFAALAAAGLPVAVTFAGPILGGSATVCSYLMLATAAYVGGLSERRSQRLAAMGIAALAGFGLALAPIGLPGTALGAACVVAFCRSGVHWRQRPLRALAIELTLGASGLLLARYLAGGGLVGVSLAVWGYFLVQSTYFLIGGRSVRHTEAPQDPFERARLRLERLLAD